MCFLNRLRYKTLRGLDRPKPFPVQSHFNPFLVIHKFYGILYRNGAGNTVKVLPDKPLNAPFNKATVNKRPCPVVDNHDTLHHRLKARLDRLLPGSSSGQYIRYLRQRKLLNNTTPASGISSWAATTRIDPQYHTVGGPTGYGQELVCPLA